MSQDLFAAFGAAPESHTTNQIWSKPALDRDEPIEVGSQQTNVWSMTESSEWNQPQPTLIAEPPAEDDDFGDFEDASATQDSAVHNAQTYPTKATDLSISTGSQPHDRKPFPPKAAPKLPFEPGPVQGKSNGSIGRHPFADHMDLLFEAGDEDYDAGADELGDLSSNPEAAMAYSKRIIAEQGARQGRSTPAKNPSQSRSKVAPASAVAQKAEPNKLRKKSGYVPPRDPNVLFDADDLSEHDDDEGDDDDDFDNFENGVAPPTQVSAAAQPNNSTHGVSMPQMDLLGWDDPVDTATDTPSISRASHIHRTDHSVKSEPQPTDADEFWDDFESAAPVEDPNQPAQRLPMSPALSTAPPKLPKPDDVLPPTNVPPPVVLLSLFPPIFAEADSVLLQGMTKLDAKQRLELLTHAATQQFLMAYLGHGKVLGRIVAGRKLRWKRDQRLSQSMRIDPAAAGGKGGMKLTGLDKSEAAKEDREVLDVLTLWKNRLGRLRTAVVAASSVSPGFSSLHIPDLTGPMTIKTLRPTEGGVAAAQPCALCGLKRDERVVKVDVDVDDTFGEWWDLGMHMHVACRDFWAEYQDKLKSR